MYMLSTVVGNDAWQNMDTVVLTRPTVFIGGIVITVFAVSKVSRCLDKKYFEHVFAIVIFI